MNAERHQIVHEIVFAGDRVEHLADQSALGLLRDLAKTEVGGPSALVVGGAHD